MRTNEIVQFAFSAGAEAADGVEPREAALRMAMAAAVDHVLDAVQREIPQYAYLLERQAQRDANDLYDFIDRLRREPTLG